jgi:Ca-activated chloride channel family protein
MKYRWPVRPPRLALLTLVCFVTSAAQAGTWTNLWSTREQQAQKLLDAKDPAAAAPLFSDARRRAYAEMEAGQYAKAAKSLAPFKDADSQYNRGNALAHSGQLREALSAYDTALRAAPGDKDAIRNRDLVRRALERQQQNQSGKQGGANGRSGAQGSQGGQSQGGNQNQRGSQSQPNNPSQAGNQPQNNGSQSQAGSQPQPGSQSQAGQPQGSNPTQRGQSKSTNPSQPANPSGGQSQADNQQGGSQPQSGGQSQSNHPQGAAQPPAQAATQTPSSAARPGDHTSGEGALAPNGQQTNGSTATAGLNAENAQQDADAALRYRQSQQGRAAPGAGPNDAGRATLLGPEGKARSSAAAPPPKPPSEQTLALDQWLRGIPDDSGELLRRKFLIEHMLKQQSKDQ